MQVSPDAGAGPVILVLQAICKRRLRGIVFCI